MTKPVNINTVLFLILALLIPLFASLVYYKEGFVNNMLSPGKYPQIQDKPLLNEYHVKKNATVSNKQSSSIWKDYPVYPSSYKQQTNNKRYWNTPDNGLCSRAEFCGALYDKKKISEEPIPPMLKPYTNINRVNYYEANECYA